MTPLSQQLADYLAVRRSLGFDMTFEERVLRVFTAFADREAVDHITVDLFLRWKAAFGTANNNTWAHRLGMVRGFARWLKGYDERTEVPPPGLIPAKWQRPRPLIYSDKQVAAVVARAAKLRSHYGLRGWTFSTLFGLIAVTGLRINEALKLDDDDVDLDAGVITVKRGKNGKARFVPIAPSTVNRLAAYRAECIRLLGVRTGAFFSNDDGRRPTDCSARYNFAIVSQDMGLREAQRFCKHGRGPRIHDLRHTFAVRTGAWDSGVKLTALVARNARMKCLGATDQSTAAVLIGKDQIYASLTAITPDESQAQRRGEGTMRQDFAARCRDGTLRRAA